MSLASLFIGPGTILLDFETPDRRGELAMLWAVAGAGLLYLGLAMLRLVVIRRDTTRWRRWRDAGIGLVLVAAPLMVIAGMAPWAAAAAAWLLPLIAVLIDRRFFLPASWVGRAQDDSVLRTRFLKIVLDPHAGTPDGVVTTGRLKGCRLSGLSSGDLEALRHEISSDPESVSLLTSILLQFQRDASPGVDDGRSRSHRSRRTGAGDGAQRGTAMSVEEACRVLGVAPGVSESAILAAHRKLMKLVHPDKGGSDYLASKINEARDLLLGR